MITHIVRSGVQKRKSLLIDIFMYSYFKDYYLNLVRNNTDVDFGIDERKNREIRFFITQKVQGRYPCVKVVKLIKKIDHYLITAQYKRVEEGVVKFKTLTFKAKIIKADFKINDLITIDYVKEETTEEETDSVYDDIEKNKDKIRPFKVIAKTNYIVKGGSLDEWIRYQWDKSLPRFPNTFQSLPDEKDGTKLVDIDLKNAFTYFTPKKAKEFNILWKNKKLDEKIKQKKIEQMLWRCIDDRENYKIKSADVKYIDHTYLERFNLNVEQIKTKVLKEKHKIYRFYKLKEEIKECNLNNTMLSPFKIVEFYYILQCITQRIKEKLEKDTKIIVVNYTGNGFSVLCKYEEGLIKIWQKEYLIDSIGNLRRWAQRMIGCTNLEKLNMQAVIPFQGEICNMKFPQYKVFAVSNPAFFKVNNNMTIKTRFGSIRPLFTVKREGKIDLGWAEQTHRFLIPTSQQAVDRTEYYIKQKTRQRKTIERFIDEKKLSKYYEYLTEYLKNWMIDPEQILELIFR